jgi:hypothetical protein
MNLFNSLPFELQDYIFDIDGRYKTAMAQCFLRIKQRRYSPTGMYASGDGRLFDNIHFVDDIPEYHAEFQTRVAKYREVFHRTGQIPRVTTHLRRLPKMLTFRDAFGRYKLGMVHDSIVIDGRTYISSDTVLSVASDETRRTDYYEYRRAHGTQTAVKCIDILNRDFNKKIQRRKNPSKLFRDLGVSENGIPAPIFKRFIRGNMERETYPKGHKFYKANKPPASLTAVTEFMTARKWHGEFMIPKPLDYNVGKKFTICVKTGTGLLYHDGVVVGYITKQLKCFTFRPHAQLPAAAPVPAPVPVAPLPLPVPAPAAFVYNPQTDIEVEIDGMDYVVRNDLDIINIHTGYIVGTRVDDDEVEWLGDAR